jgi:twitching motility protein PilJ
VSSSANEIQSTTEHLSTGSEAQAAQILDTTAAINEMAVSIQQVSENTVSSAEVAQTARDNAVKGAEAVQSTIKGMDRIRDQVQDTSKRIKRLGESSQQIGDIADRTSILALNASIQAAMAGEAGQGFAVVAEEVERLAERANDATKQIGTLIKSELAADAGASLEEINSVSRDLAELMQQISLAAKQQARGAESVPKSMGEISEVTQQTAAGTRQAAFL